MKTDNKSGFTLVELLISVSLLILVIGISMSSYLAIAKSSAIAKQFSTMHGDLRFSFDKMTKELVSSSGIWGGGEHWFRFVAERPAGPQQVYYVFSNNKLYQMDADLQVIADNVTDFEYTMYKEDGVTTTTTYTNAYSIDIYMKVEKQVTDELFDDVLQTRVMLRNKQ